VLFAESSLLSEPACALIYAAPIEFYFRIGARGANDYFTDYKILPNPPVIKRPPTGDDWRAERRDDEAAIEVMRKVVRKRLENRGLQPQEVVTSEALDVMAKMSGGVMRDLIRLFSDAATFAQTLKRERIDEEIARKAVYKYRREMSARMTVVLRNALIDVLKEGYLKNGNQTEAEDDLVKALYLLSYQSGDDTWFDAHPNLLPVL
jgi:DNA polymerase III delta prime subunit